MATARLHKGLRPSMAGRADGEFTRADYADWVQRFRARWSDRTLTLRPQTYRSLFKKAMGIKR